MSKIITDDRSLEIKEQHKLVLTWETANPIAKQGLTPPPKYEDFDNRESYDEAKNYWSTNIGRILSLREQALKR